MKKRRKRLLSLEEILHPALEDIYFLLLFLIPVHRNMVITGAKRHVLIPEQRKPHRNVLHLTRFFKSVDIRTCQASLSLRSR